MRMATFKTRRFGCEQKAVGEIRKASENFL